jgi:hypothetical protein
VGAVVVGVAAENTVMHMMTLMPVAVVAEGLLVPDPTDPGTGHIRHTSGSHMLQPLTSHKRHKDQRMLMRTVWAAVTVPKGQSVVHWQQGPASGSGAPLTLGAEAPDMWSLCSMSHFQSGMRIWVAVVLHPIQPSVTSTPHRFLSDLQPHFSSPYSHEPHDRLHHNWNM